MIAGPNGAGKTTLTDRLRKDGIQLGKYINPDDIAKDLIGSPIERAAKSQAIADQKRDTCILAKQSFTFETVMSHPSKVDILVRAKEAGFFVQLFYIGTDDPKTNIERVANRVAEGGHDVPTEKIISRWGRTMRFLHEAIRAVDDALIFDNSIAGFIGGGPRLVFRRSLHKTRNLPQSEQFPPLPEWVQEFVLEPLGIEYFGPPTLASFSSVITAPFLAAKPRSPSLSEAEKEIAPPSTASFETEPHQISQALVAAVDMAARAYIREGKLGLATGLVDLDRKLSGLGPSELIILAARSGMGKTALATTIAYNVARAWKGEARSDETIVTVDGGIVGIFSLEMSAEQLATRIIAQQSGIPASNMKRGAITERDFEAIKDAAIELQHLPFYIDDTGAITISQLVARARRLKHDRGLDMIIIDNLELLQTATKRSAAEARNAGKITSQLKFLAKELNIPVVALSQLPLKIDTRRDKRPKLTDLRDSSAEQDSDVVLFVYREDHYLLNEEPLAGTYEHVAWIQQVEAAHGKAEIIVARNRNGPTGAMTLFFDATTGRFDNLQHF
jgi:replicative DNA helicase